MKKLKEYPESFRKWIDLNYEKFFKRYEFIGQPERGNWTLKELHKKYKMLYGKK